MSWSSQFTRGALRYSPRLLKDAVRKLTPQAFYQLVARTAAGESSAAGPHGLRGQLYLSDPRVRALEDRLWHGFSRLAGPELEELVRTSKQAQRRAEAAMALTRHHMTHGDCAAALEQLATVEADSRGLWKHKRTRILQMYALTGVGKFAAAHAVANEAINAYPQDASVAMACASTILAAGQDEDRHQAEQTWLSMLNQVLERGGFVGLALRDHKRGLHLDNLKAQTAPPEPENMSAKVSVLMAVYNGADNLQWVVRSLLEQTWGNLELVIVDDASTDDSWQVIQELASADRRIVPLRQRENGGAYIARNAALAAATGDYVTVNDADDWAHPQKIEAQVMALRVPVAPLANTSSLIRVDKQMMAQPRFDSPHAAIVHKNFSALMLPRNTALEMGGWDRVRISGDSEFIGRLAAKYGEAVLEQPYPSVPLSLALLEKNNLTASSARSLGTFHWGVRREYARQYKEWHRALPSEPMARHSQWVPFPVPGLCLRKGAPDQYFDTIVLSDFSDPADLAPYVDQGHGVAVVVWPDYGSCYAAAMHADVSRLCREHGIVTLTHGERARCRRLLVPKPRLLLRVPDKIPSLDAEGVWMPEQGWSTPERDQIGRAAERLFGQIMQPALDLRAAG